MLSASSKQKSTRILFHVLTWVLLLIFPSVLSLSEGSTINYSRLIKYTFTPLFFYAIIFYSNYLFLIERFLFKRKMLAYVACNVLMIVFFTWLHFQIIDILKMTMDVKPLNPPPPGPPRQFFIYKDIIAMIIPIIIAYALATSEKWQKTETEKKEREKNLLDSELQHLKYQLQPHFFFNSLNTIYALIGRSPELAQETVHSLAKLMRYMLYETENGKVNLNEDIAFMKQYIELMRLRLSDKTRVNVNFPVSSQHLEIAPLLFISLIENAFKHGISATQPSELFFKLEVKEGMIRFVAENTNFPKNEKDKSGSGIGLSNLKKRLELAYPGQHQFQTAVEGQVFRVLLEIEVKQSAVLSA